MYCSHINWVRVKFHPSSTRMVFDKIFSRLNNSAEKIFLNIAAFQNSLSIVIVILLNEHPPNIWIQCLDERLLKFEYT